MTVFKRKKKRPGRPQDTPETTEQKIEPVPPKIKPGRPRPPGNPDKQLLDNCLRRHCDYEDGEVSGPGGRRVDITVNGRPFPYAQVDTIDREGSTSNGDQARLGMLGGTRKLPILVGKKQGMHPAPYPGPHNGSTPIYRRRDGGGKKVKILPGWLTWGAYHSLGRYASFTPERDREYINENPEAVFDLAGSGMLRTFEDYGVALGREESGPDEQPHYVIVAGDGTSVTVVFRFDSSWEPFAGAGPYGGWGPTPMRFSLSDDAKHAITLWGATNSAGWASTAPVPNIGGPECRDEE